MVDNLLLTRACASGHAYRQDRRYFAVAEKHKGKESLAIYDAGDRYNLVRVCILFRSLLG